jgi:hypothetical protein
MPDAEEVGRPLTATITYVGGSIDSASRLVPLWAELRNPNLSLMPGGTATMVIEPK